MRANSLDLKEVSICDPFWSKHVDLVRNTIIPYQWEAMNDRIPMQNPAIVWRILKLQQEELKVIFMELFFRIQMLPNGWKQ